MPGMARNARATSGWTASIRPITTSTSLDTSEHIIHLDRPYSYPVYSEPVYQPQVAVAPPVQREVCYVGGCYRLQGDGVTVAYQWVLVPTAPPPSPGPPGR